MDRVREMIQDIKTIILPLDENGMPDPIESKLVNEHLSDLRKKSYFSNSHIIIQGNRSNVVVGANGNIYTKQDCMFESLIMAQVIN